MVYVLIVGNMVDGATFYGPWDCMEVASMWAEMNIDSEWTIAPLTQVNPTFNPI